MKMKHFWLVAFIVGTILPYWQFGNFFVENGFNMALFFEQLLATRVSKFFMYDVLVSAVVVVVLVTQHRKLIRLYWLPIIATLTIGVSAGLPLYLYLAELAAENRSAANADPVRA